MIRKRPTFLTRCLASLGLICLVMYLYGVAINGYDYADSHLNIVFGIASVLLFFTSKATYKSVEWSEPKDESGKIYLKHMRTLEASGVLLLLPSFAGVFFSGFIQNQHYREVLMLCFGIFVLIAISLMGVSNYLYLKRFEGR